VAARSKALTVFARPNTGIMGSIPIRSMDVCVRLFCVYVAVLRRADPPSNEFLPTVYKLSWKIGQGPQGL
jgi:hypothetical protein